MRTPAPPDTRVARRLACFVAKVGREVSVARVNGQAGWCGVWNVAKPKGVTSRDVVNRVARPLRGVKVGHAGTLDPLASGVLVVAVGGATRLIEYVQREPKTYRTAVRLGATSDTLDADGTVVEVEGASDRVPTLEQVRAAVAGQVGTVLQVPPGYSALRVRGRRAYELARAGEAVELAPRPVTVHRIDVTAYAWPLLELEVFCEGGTYIRSIARDVGEALGCGGLVEVLTRTAIGPFTLADALDLDTLPDPLTRDSLAPFLKPAAAAVAALPSLTLSAGQVADVVRGRAVVIGPGADAGGEVALLGPDGLLVAVGEAGPDGRVAPRRVLAGG